MLSDYFDGGTLVGIYKIQAFLSRKARQAHVYTHTYTKTRIRDTDLKTTKEIDRSRSIIFGLCISRVSVLPSGRLSCLCLQVCTVSCCTDGQKKIVDG